MNSLSLLLPFHSFPNIAVGKAIRSDDDSKTLYLAERMMLRIDENADIRLFYDSRGYLSLDVFKTTRNPFSIDFLDGKMGYRASKMSDELILKAVRPESEKNRLVWDMTAGLGRDSFMLACAGCTVVMFERSSIIAALLQDALDRLLCSNKAQAEIASRLSLHVMDSRYIDAQFLSTHAQPGVCLVDPMFPVKKKKALVKKDMQILQSLFEHERISSDNSGADISEVFSISCTLAKSKVVVKRPMHGDFIVTQPKPSYSICGKSNRFDIYSQIPTKYMDTNIIV